MLHSHDPSGIGRYLERQRQQLSAAETRVQQRLGAQFQATVHQVSPHVRSWADAYSRELARVRAESGNPLAQVSEAWAKQHLDGEAGQRLQRFVQVEVGRFGAQARNIIGDGTADALNQGTEHAQALLGQAMSPLSGALAGKGMAPADLVKTVRGDALVGLENRWLSAAGDERLANIWFRYGDQASQDLYQLLHAALRAGDNPNAVADDIRSLLVSAGITPSQELLDSSQAITQAWAGQMARYLAQARAIARTEMLGAYRDAQLSNYRANADIVRGWYWSAAIGACALCTDLDGTFHTFDESMDGVHVNCRCSPQPATASWADILGPLGIDASDIPETSFAPQLGSDWFDEQSDDYQLSILGPAAFNAYQAGALTLDDLVGQTADGQYYQKSMKSLGLDAQAWLGRGPNAGVAVRVPVRGGGFTYVTPGPQRQEEPQFNTAGRSESWAGIDDAMRGLRD